jgi:hypothetical protein
MLLLLADENFNGRTLRALLLASSPEEIDGRIVFVPL